MHELELLGSGGSQILDCHDGLVAIPGSPDWVVVASVGAATLVGPDRALPLVAGQPVELGECGDRLCWRTRSGAPSPVRPAHIGGEATRQDAVLPAEAELVLHAALGQEIPLGDDLLLVGRHPACHLRPADARASMLHCAMKRVSHGVSIIDLGSTNGTWVDGARVGAVVLRRGARICVGATGLVLKAVARRPAQVELPSLAMAELWALVAKVAPTDASVLIQGESGVGKDSVARRLHEASGRLGPLVTLNAAAIAPALAGSELFGHVRGAFTGAEQDHDGAFLAAAGGTLFLDEIAELPLPTQAELLRAVEVKRVRRVGELVEIPVDVRLVVATHRDLAARVREGSFREDLYHRLCVVPVFVPPLRERADDLAALARAFLAAQPTPRTLSPAGLTHLELHPWPGNIRELFNVLSRACVLSDATELGPEHLPLCLSMAPHGTADQAMHARILTTFKEYGGNIAAVAERLRLHRATVYRHVRQERTKAHIGG